MFLLQDLVDSCEEEDSGGHVLWDTMSRWDTIYEAVEEKHRGHVLWDTMMFLSVCVSLSLSPGRNILVLSIDNSLQYIITIMCLKTVTVQANLSVP